MSTNDNPSQHVATTTPEIGANGFTMTPNRVVRDPGLSLQARAAYAVLRDKEWQLKEPPSIYDLLPTLDVNRKTAKRYMDELVRSGLVEEIAGAGSTPTRYRLVVQESDNEAEAAGTAAESDLPREHAAAGSERDSNPAHIEEIQEVKTSPRERRDRAAHPAKELVGLFAQLVRERTGTRPPSDVLALLGRNAARLLEDEVDAEEIAAGIELMVERGKTPSLLSELVLEASLKQAAREGASERPRTTLERALSWVSTGAGGYLGDEDFEDELLALFAGLSPAELEQVRRERLRVLAERKRKGHQSAGSDDCPPVVLERVRALRDHLGRDI